MGTRATYGFKKNGKYKVTYSNCDGNYEWLGNSIVTFINNTSINELNNIYDRILLVEPLDVPTEKQILECKKYADLNISTRTLKDFSCLLAKTICNLQYYRDDSKLKYMINYENFLYRESYQYIINLDSNQLEIYFYEILVNSYELSNIPKNWITECDKKLEELE